VTDDITLTHGKPMKQIRISLPTLLLLVAVVGGGAFAGGRALPTDSTSSGGARPDTGEREAQDPPDWQEQQESQWKSLLMPAHAPMDDPTSGPPIGTDTTEDDVVDDGVPLRWTAPARWQLAPRGSEMRLATYRIPRAPGDATDADLSIARAGGSVDANVERWIGQFDVASQATARRTARKVGLLDVVVVDVRGTYLGGMGMDHRSQPGWMLLGAIVATPGMPVFIKLTGPEKSVAAARREFDGFIDGLRQDGDGGK